MTEPLAPAGRLALRLRVGVYVIALIALGQWVCFYHLERGMLIDDESAFGITTDMMRETGEYVVPCLGDKQPHMNAAPLYNWLCCLTADLFPDTPVRYRFWSGVFAILCALAVLALGTELFQAEVGFLAGVLMLTNQYFLFQHGARSGVMEPATALFIVVMTHGYVRTTRPGADPTFWWAMVGISLGGAVMMKPPAMGGFFFTLIALHHLFARRDVPIRVRINRPLWAAGVACVIALPWYALICHRLGWVAIQNLFIYNSVGRMADAGGSPPPYTLYFDFLRHSSRAAVVFWPALAAGAVFSALGWLRPAWWIPTMMAGAYTVTLSLSATKNPHYIYSGFPFLCLLAAAVLYAGFLPRPRVLGNGFLAVTGWRLLRLAGVVVAFFLVKEDVARTRLQLKAQTWDYPPLTVYRLGEPAVAAGQGHFVLYGGFPVHRERTNAKMGFGSIDVFYRSRLPLAEHAKNVLDLNELLVDGKPAVVFLPPKRPLSDLVRDGLAYTPERVVRLRSERMYYTVLLFNGAEAGFGLTEYFRKDEVPASEPDRF